MKKIIAILSLALASVLSPLTGPAQTTGVSALHRSHFKIDKLSTRQGEHNVTWVYGEITSNAKKEARTVWITVRWLDKDGHVVDHYSTHVPDLAPGETLPFQAPFTKKPPEAVRYDAYVRSVEED